MSARVRMPGVVDLGDRVTLPPEAEHHLRSVLRMKLHERCVAIDANGVAYDAEIVGWDPAQVLISDRHEHVTAVVATQLEVFVPILKGGRTDALVRQLTELGVVRLVPMIWERGQGRPQGEKAEKMEARWRRISAEATRQCERHDTVEIARCQTELPDGPGVFLHAREGLRPAQAWAEATGGAIRVAVGPEGGFTEEETAALRVKGWLPVHLQAPVMRAETAVIAAAVLAMHGGYTSKA